MRLASLAVIGLIMASTPAHAGAPSAKAACVASLEKAEGSSGFEVVRTCDKAVLSKAVAAKGMARQPIGVASNLAQSGDSDDSDASTGSVILTSLLAASAFIGGLVIAFDSNDRPTSP